MHLLLLVRRDFHCNSQTWLQWRCFTRQGRELSYTRGAVALGEGTETGELLHNGAESCILVTCSNDLQPTNHGLQPTSDGLQLTSDGLQPTSDGLQPTSDGLQPTNHVLQPTSDGLQPTSDGLQPT